MQDSWDAMFTELNISMKGGAMDVVVCYYWFDQMMSCWNHVIFYKYKINILPSSLYYVNIIYW